MSTPPGGGLGDPVGLVLGEESDPPVRAPVLVAGHGEVVRTPLGDQASQAVEEAPNGVDGPAVGCEGAGGGDPIEGAEDQAGAVDEKPITRHGAPSGTIDSQHGLAVHAPAE